MKRLRRVEDLLTPQQHADLRADLEEMARQRRMAYASAAQWIFP